MTTENLQQLLEDFPGGECCYAHPIHKRVHYTEGVHLFATKANAYWFIDILATQPKILTQQAEFALIELKVENQQAQIQVNDGDNGPMVFEQHIDYTDCPPGLYRFYFIKGMIMLDREY